MKMVHFQHSVLKLITSDELSPNYAKNTSHLSTGSVINNAQFMKGDQLQLI